jgi:hypothetical protein
MHFDHRQDSRMNTPNNKSLFLLGNALLGVALVMLIFLGKLWEILGAAAMVLWMIVAGVGMYLVTRDKGPSSNFPG